MNAYVMERLAQLRAGEGDYTGLKRPTKETLDRAEQVAVEVLTPGIPTPSVVPDYDGNIIFSWHKSGFTVEVTVKPNKIEFWLGTV